MTRHNAELNAQRDTQHTNAVNHALATSTPTTAGTAEHTHWHHDPADAQLLRGIPAVGGHGSIGGHIHGTRPDTLAWDDTRTRRHPRSP